MLLLLLLSSKSKSKKEKEKEKGEKKKRQANATIAALAHPAHLQDQSQWVSIKSQTCDWFNLMLGSQLMIRNTTHQTYLKGVFDILYCIMLYYITLMTCVLNYVA